MTSVHEKAAPQTIEATTPSPEATSNLVRSAGINSLGNISSRLLGVVRESVIASNFGASGATSAFDAVSAVPKMVYELLIGGMLSAALVPVLSEYAAGEKGERHDQLDEALSILLSLAAVVLVGVTLVLEIVAPWIAPILVGGFDESLLATTTILLRLIVPAILIYGLSGILQAYHYAREAFIYPSMGAPAHNLGIIIAVIILARRLDIYALSIGIVAAALCQFLIQLPGMRGVRLRWHLEWRHPIIQRILGLYAPVVISIVIQNIGIIIDRNLASRTAPEAITWMNKATFLIQLPLGLVSMAVSLAILPTLSQIDAKRDLETFKQTFMRGLRLVLIVIIPATAGLFAMGRPFIALLFEHGAFIPHDTMQTWQALRIYLIGLPFAAIDLPLVFAFYAQKDTRTPVLVGILGVALYLLVAPTLAFIAGWGYLGLVAANAVQLTAHALIMLALFARRFQGIRGYRLGRTIRQTLIAAGGVALAGYGSYRLLLPFAPVGLLGQVLLAGAPTLIAIAAYMVCAQVLGIREWETLWKAVRAR